MAKQNRSGQSLVIVALFMPLLIVMAGAGLSLGIVYYKQTQLQNAADAAAMAGAQQELLTHPSLTQPTIAHNTSTLLGQDAPGSTGKFVNNAGTFTFAVTAHQTVPGTFLAIIGYKTFSVQAQAVASYATSSRETGSSSFDYAIFQGSHNNTLTFSGGGNDIKGSIHSNNNIQFSGGGNTVTQDVNASGTLSTEGGGNHFGSIENKEPYIATPLWTIPQSIYPSQSNALVVHRSYVLKGGQTLDKSLIVYGNITNAGGGWSVHGSVESIGGTIDIAGGGDTVTGNVIAKQGNIAFGGGGNTIDGNVLASQGSITFSGGGNRYGGYIIANQGSVTFDGGGNTLSPDLKGLTIAAFATSQGQHGNITFNGGGGNNYGLLYAPQGHIAFNGGGGTFRGAIIGNTLDFNGGGNKVTYNAAAATNVPSGNSTSSASTTNPIVTLIQ